MSSNIWKSCLSQLEKNLNEEEVTAWLRSLSAETTDSVMVLSAPNRFVKRKIESDYLARITEILCSLTGSDFKVRVDIGSVRNTKNKSNSTGNVTKSTTGRKRTPAIKKQPYGFEKLNPDYTFDQHVVGESNQLARYAAQRASEDPGLRDHNPLFIYGDVGNGKTHLMQATGHELMKNFPDKKIGYIRANNFVRHLVVLIRRKDNESIELFKNFYLDLDVLLIDDIHHFAGADVSQQEFLHTFNTLLEGNKQIIITSDRFFMEIPDVENRLKSRLGQGIAIRVKPPELETRITILVTKAARRGIKLKPEVSWFVAEKIKGSVRELEGALNQLIASHNFTHQPITIQLAKSTLSDLLEFNSKPIDIPTILREVARFHGIRVDDILSKSRKANVAKARHVAMVLSRRLTTLSLPQIAKAIGDRNHTTVIHAEKKITDKMETDITFKSEFNTLMEILSP